MPLDIIMVTDKEKNNVNRGLFMHLEINILLMYCIIDVFFMRITNLKLRLNIRCNKED